MMKPRREYQRQIYVPAAAQPMIAKAFAVAAERGESFSAFVVAAIREKLRRLGVWPPPREEEE